MAKCLPPLLRQCRSSRGNFRGSSDTVGARAETSGAPPTVSEHARSFPARLRRCRERNFPGTPGFRIERGNVIIPRSAAGLSLLGRLNRRLGLDADEIVEAARRALASPWLEPAALNFYLSTQQSSLGGFARVFRGILDLVKRLAAEAGVVLREVNLGGGIPSPTLRRRRAVAPPRQLEAIHAGPGLRAARARLPLAPGRPCLRGPGDAQEHQRRPDAVHLARPSRGSCASCSIPSTRSPRSSRSSRAAPSPRSPGTCW
jgi:hypothetical protein